MSSLFEAYITNLGKYNEGQLVGETLKFPATTEEVQALLKRIGVDGVRYEEIFITSFDGDVLGLYDHLGEYESIDELNHLAHVLSDLDQSDIEKFEAVIDSGEYTGSVHDLINLAQNLDCYDFYPGIDSEEALGRAYIEEMEMLDVPDNVLPYVWLTIGVNPVYVDTGIRIESAADLCGRCLDDVATDVLYMTGNDHALEAADPLELAEIKRRWEPYINQLPDYAYLCKDLLNGKM